jgi:hypothetical protein
MNLCAEERGLGGVQWREMGVRYRGGKGGGGGIRERGGRGGGV